MRPAQSANQKGPYDYIIVQGHRDIWEFNDRFRIGGESQRSPLRDHLLPRLLEGGINVVIMPVGGDHPRHRGFNDRPREGSLQIVDMLLVEVEKTEGKAGIIRSKADIPSSPERNRVMFFLDIEGGSPIEIEPESDDHPDRRLAMLRNFYRLGVRGLQLTHDGRNQLGDGQAEGRPGNRLSKFGVEVVQEMNRLGMVVGVSHLSMNGILHVAEITKHPVITEIRAGTYIFNDRNEVGCGVAGFEDCAATVLTTVVSTSVPGRAIADGGSKTFSADR